MKLILLGSTLCAVSSSLLAAPFAELSFEAASKKAADSGKIVLIDFYTTWCGPCKMLDKTTWSDDAVIKLLEQKTVALRIDAEKDTNLAARYNIQAYPSVLLIKPDGTEIDRLVGYRNAETFLSEFDQATHGKDAVGRARETMEAAGTNNPQARMQYGKALAQKGKDAEALQEYLWCFDYGAEADPSFFGVRLSFLLGDIKELAAHYKPAAEALQSRRDARQAKVDSGSTNFHTVQEIVGLNNALDENEKNLALFDKLPAGSMGRKVILGLCADQFLEAKRYADLLQGSDGSAAFQKSVDNYNRMTGQGKPKKANAPQLEKALRQIAISSGTHYFEALAEKVLDFDSTEASRDQLSKAAERAGNNGLARAVKQAKVSSIEEY